MTLLDHLASGRLLHAHGCAHHVAEGRRDDALGSIISSGADPIDLAVELRKLEDALAEACDCGVSRLGRIARQAIVDNAWTIGHIDRVFDAEELSQQARVILHDESIDEDDPRRREMERAARRAWGRADLGRTA